MAIKLQSVGDAIVSQGIKMLVMGAAGSGKTVLCSTSGADTVIMNAEAGLLSLNKRIEETPELAKTVRVATVQTLTEIGELYDAFAKKQIETEWLCIDSLSEVAEVVLSAELKKFSDPRQAYGALIEQMSDLVRAFRDLSGINVVMTAKMERIKDDASGAMLYSAMLPGSKLSQQIPYWFDEVLVLRAERTEQGEIERRLQTVRDFQYDCKDRSGRLDAYEPPDLAHIAAKIRNHKTASGRSAGKVETLKQRAGKPTDQSTDQPKEATNG